MYPSYYNLTHIHEFVLLSAKILVAGGFHPLEIIDLINTKFKYDIVVDENENEMKAGATGG